MTLQQNASQSGIVRDWDFVSIGVDLGSKTFYGGSVGSSLITKPLYLYKVK